MADQLPDASGHRARLRKRLFEGGPDALLDHELVEYLLALAIPRRDTKPLARKLLAEFGGFGPLLSADADAIARIGEVSEGAAAAVKIAQASALRLLESRFSNQPVLGSWQALLDYLRADMAFHPVERVRVLFLNSRNMLIRNEPMSEGSVDEAAVYVREVIRRALDYQATAIILVHNHPSGDPQPSAQDIRLTRDIVEAGRPLKIEVHDHVVIGAKGHVSMRAMGLI
jgi:DNA repair protein RadC